MILQPYDMEVRAGTFHPATTVRGTTGTTPYIRFGNHAFLVLGALALAAAWFLGRNYRKKKPQVE